MVDQMNWLFRAWNIDLAYGSKEYEPPTKFDAAFDYGSSVALVLLMLLVFSFNVYSQINLSNTYYVVPEGMSVIGWIAEQEQSVQPWEKPFELDKEVITSEEWEDLLEESTSITRTPNTIGILGIVFYILMRLKQPWYRKRAIRKLNILQKKGRVS